MSQGVTLSVLRLQEAWGLCAHGHQVVNIFHLVQGFHICKKNSGNVHQILLPMYFTEKIKQRIWGKACPRKIP